VRALIERAKRDPRRHVLVRGSTRENQENLTEDFVRELERTSAATQRAREEMEGEFFDDAEGALFKQEWIDRARRDMPTTFKRRAISVDPAISLRKGTDATGHRRSRARHR
jgi:phage terminase large subunit-like protein